VIQASALSAVDLPALIKGESVAELTGFMAALRERMRALDAPADRSRPVVLPTYNGARRLPNLTALLALLLRRYGVPVLLHGMAGEASDHRRVATAAILRELGIEPAASVAEAQQRLAAENIVYVPVDVLAPGLAPLLALRRRMGMRSSALAVAKLIDPFDGVGFRVVNVEHSECFTRTREYLAATHADALLLRGTEGEPFANPRRQPRLECFAAGVGTIMFDAQSSTPATSPALPAAVDARTTAAWIADALAGEHPIPPPILNELACCMHATRRITSITS
jgi:anthranilate phosphoribosyltransferase